MNEEFKSWWRNYEVSNLGRTRRKKKDGTYYYQKHKDNKGGYKFITVRENGKYKNKYIHHIVAMVFLGLKPSNCEIDHIDRNRTNNKLDNLRYVSRLENNQNSKVFIEELGKDLTGTERRKERAKYRYLQKVKTITYRAKGQGSIKPRKLINGTVRYYASIRIKVNGNIKTFYKTCSSEEEAIIFINDSRRKFKQMEYE